MTSKQTTTPAKPTTGKQATPKATDKQADPTPAKQAAKPTPQNCACGCNQPTITAKAAFLSGHDARFAGRYGRGEIRLNAHQKAVLDASPRLQAKVDGIIQTHAKRLAAKKAVKQTDKTAA